MIRFSLLRRSFVCGALAAGIALLGAGLAAPARADYPERNVTLVVPYPAGGTTDIVARILAQQLGADLGKNVLIENKGGASTAIGAHAVAVAPKDGYTLLFGAGTTFTTNPHLLPDIKYKLADFAPIAMVVKVPFAFIVKKDFPAKTLEEFRAYAQANPGKINNATNGRGSTVHLLGELTARGLGVKVQHVHYRGAAPAMNDIIAGTVDSNVEALTNAVPNHNAGQYRALAVLSDKRLPQLPDVPTFKELGYPSVIGETWFAVFAPTGTPQDIVTRLSKAISTIVASPDFARRMHEIGNVPAVMSPAELDTFVRGESDRLGTLIKDAGITID